MKSFAYTITDPQGVHARPAGVLVKQAKAVVPCTVTIEKDGKKPVCSGAVFLSVNFLQDFLYLCSLTEQKLYFVQLDCFVLPHGIPC